MPAVIYQVIAIACFFLSAAVGTAAEIDSPVAFIRGRAMEEEESVCNEKQSVACLDPANANTYNLYGEFYGSENSCLVRVTTLGQPIKGLCYKTACANLLQGVVFLFNIRGEWFRCQSEGQELNVRVGAGLLPITVICPPLESVCRSSTASPISSTPMKAPTPARLASPTPLPTPLPTLQPTPSTLQPTSFPTGTPGSTLPGSKQEGLAVPTAVSPTTETTIIADSSSSRIASKNLIPYSAAMLVAVALLFV